MSALVPPCRLCGVGLWTPRYPDVPAFVAGTPSSEPVDEPPAPLIAARQRRRATRLARMAASAMAEACAMAGLDPATVPTVFASMLGEVEASVALIEMMETSGMVSPTRFQNSVHNTASGLLSIATGNPGFTTSVSAGFDLVAMALLEGIGVAVTRGEPVVVVIEEERWPACLRAADFDPACVALAVRPVVAVDAPYAPHDLATLSRLRRCAPEDTPSFDALEPALRESPVAPALGLVRAALAPHESPRTVRLEGGPARMPWSIVLTRESS